MDVYNLSFDESQQRIVQAWRKKLSDDHASPAHMEKMVIVSYVRRHPVALADASKAYEEATSSTVKFLLAENARMEKDLQEAMQRTEQSVGSVMEEMRKVILAEVSTLETTMRKHYDKFFIVHKAIFHLYGFQQQCMKIVQTLKYIHDVITHV